jgi:hypothetical protein
MQLMLLGPGSIDLMAPVMTAFFCLTFCVINLTCFLLEIANEEFVPDFQLHSKYTSLAGLVLSFCASVTCTAWGVSLGVTTFMVFLLWWRRRALKDLLRGGKMGRAEGRGGGGAATEAERWELTRIRDWLATVKTFEGLDVGGAVMTRLARQLEPRAVPPGALVITKGDNPGHAGEMYFIREGKVEVLAALENEPLAVLGSGQFFGESALLFSAPRDSHVRARGPLELYVLGKANLEAVFAEFPGLDRRGPCCHHISPRSRLCGESL